MSRTLAFDIDGTIVDKKGNIDPNVMALFNKADLNDTSFIFLSGNTMANIQQTLKAINKQLSNPTGKEIKPYLVASCGAQILSPENKIIKHSTISAENASRIAIFARHFDKGAIMIYSAGNTYFVENQDHVKRYSYARFIKNAILIRQYKKREAEKGNMGIDIKETPMLNVSDDFKNFIEENGGINSIFIASTSNDDYVQQQVATAMRVCAEGLPMYDGYIKNVPADSKKHALEYILKAENNNDKYVSDVSEVVYFGDGINDVELLKLCNLSVARGKHVLKGIQKCAMYAMDDCTEFAKDLYNGVYDNVITNQELTNRL